MRNVLLRAQRFDRVALCGAAGGDHAAQHGKQGGQNDQDQRGLRRQRGHHVHIARDVVDQHIAGMSSSRQSTTPITPEHRPMIKVSALNTCETLCLEAPMARRMPISLRRSSTLI